MRITRPQLKRSLEALKQLDNSASPYIGLQWTDSGVAFYRTSNLGFVRTLNYQPDQKALVASYSHLADTLEAIRDEELDLSVDNSGMLRLCTVDPDFPPSEVWVHTLRSNTPWAKTHNPGAITRELDPKLFSEVNTRAFALATPPVIRHGKLMLMTTAGVILRHGIADSPYPYPRENFLKALYDLDVKKLYQTVEGYWGATTENYEMVIAGHRLGDSLFDQYTGIANQVGEVAAPRFLNALTSALYWGDKDQRVEINSRTGRIESRNAQNNPGAFAFGPVETWAPFTLTAMTAKNLAATLVQSVDEKIQIAQAPNLVRLTRGLWEINMAVYR